MIRSSWLRIQPLRRSFLVTRRCSSTPLRPPAPEDGESSGIDETLLGLLGCPLTKAPLEFDDATDELVSRKIGVAYPVREGIPVLIPTEGRVLAGGAMPTPGGSAGEEGKEHM